MEQVDHTFTVDLIQLQQHSRGRRNVQDPYRRRRVVQRNYSSSFRVTQYDEVVIVDLIDNHQASTPQSHLQRPLELPRDTNQLNEVLEASFHEATACVPMNGLSQQQISSSLKIRSHQLHQETQLCTICQDEYESQQKIGTLPCKHEYHEHCIKQWLSVSTVCPICRRGALVK